MLLLIIFINITNLILLRLTQHQLFNFSIYNFINKSNIFLKSATTSKIFIWKNTLINKLLLFQSNTKTIKLNIEHKI